MEPQKKLSGWNFALIIVGVILFVVGVCVAIVLAVLLTRRIKAGCTFINGDLYLTLFVPHCTGSVSWWYWLLVAVSAVVSLTSLALWIAFGVYVSNNGMVYYLNSDQCTQFLGSCNISSLCKAFSVFTYRQWTYILKSFGCCTEFVEGGFYEDSEKWRQDNSLCETTAPNSVKNGLVVACIVFALAVTIVWISCLLLVRCALVPSSDRKYNSQLSFIVHEVYTMVCVYVGRQRKVRSFPSSH